MSALFYWWLRAQILLGVGYAVGYALGYAMTRALGQRLDPKARLGFARYAVLGALALPLLLSAVPREQLPRIGLGESKTPLESWGHAPKRRAAHTPAAAAAAEPATALSAPSWDPELWHFLEALALACFFGGAVLRARSVLRDFARLRAVLRSAYSLRRIGRTSVVAHGGISVPFSLRTPFRAWVVVPEELALRATDLGLAIRHELQHHRARDTVWVYLLEGVTVFAWPNPFAHAWKREIAELQEIACDAALLGQSRVSVHGYADCLLRVAQAALESRAVFAGTANMAAGSGNPARFQSFLGRRIEMLTKNPRRAPRVAAWLIGTAFSLALFTVAYGSQQWLDPNDSLSPGTAAVDAGVQAIAERGLAAAVSLHKARGGFVIVEEPSSGRVLAIANIDNAPDFKPRSPHWILGRRFEPASIAKGLVAAEAIEQGRVRPEDQLICGQNGVYRYHGKDYHDWEKGGFGRLSVTDTIAMSSNLCGIQIGEKLGVQGIDQMLRNFGFGPGGVAEHFPEARPGLLPDADDSPDSQYVPVVSTGYSFFPNPLETLNAYSAIANGGVLLQPVQASEKGGVERKRVLSVATAAEMRTILRKVVTDGTAKHTGQSAFYSTAGKTSSSAADGNVEADALGLKGVMSAAGFIGFAPINQPRIAVYAAIFEPTDVDGAHGSYHAAPLFREVVDHVLQSWHVAPDLKP